MMVFHELSQILVSRSFYLAISEFEINLLSCFFFSGPFQGGDNLTLQPGNYSFPFQFPLPPRSLPTSFEGVYGSIRYWIHAVADRPWRADLKFDSPLFIVERVQIRDPTLLVSQY